MPPPNAYAALGEAKDRLNRAAAAHHAAMLALEAAAKAESAARVEYAEAEAAAFAASKAAQEEASK